MSRVGAQERPRPFAAPRAMPRATGRDRQVEIIFFSIDEGASAWKIWEWPYTVRWNRIFSTIK